ncbi:hypothetical protein C8R45DRAFT_1090442 [Mycena sanguinolenta]|nr:hypothetical protein C8R45DRAFT_1090442 [Mycena sanguinolenta]
MHLSPLSPFVPERRRPSGTLPPSALRTQPSFEYTTCLSTTRSNSRMRCRGSVGSAGLRDDSGGAKTQGYRMITAVSMYYFVAIIFASLLDIDIDRVAARAYTLSASASWQRDLRRARRHLRPARRPARKCRFVPLVAMLDLPEHHPQPHPTPKPRGFADLGVADSRLWALEQGQGDLVQGIATAPASSLDFCGSHEPCAATPGPACIRGPTPLPMIMRLGSDCEQIHYAQVLYTRCRIVQAHTTVLPDPLFGVGDRVVEADRGSRPRPRTIFVLVIGPSSVPPFVPRSPPLPVPLPSRVP